MLERPLKLRKSAPGWSLPIELVRMLLHPEIVPKPTKKAGLGADNTVQRSESFDRAMFKLFAAIRERGRVPTMWNLSLAFMLDKGGDKGGCEGLRLLSNLDPVGKKYYKMLWAGCTKRSEREYASGYAKDKRREHAILTQRILGTRLAASRIGHATLFYDMRN
eukprot:2942113-Alexandrium_andersonii.AAC.1